TFGDREVAAIERAEFFRKWLELLGGMDEGLHFLFSPHRLKARQHARNGRRKGTRGRRVAHVWDSSEPFSRRQVIHTHETEISQMPTRSASAKWEGGLKGGKGSFSGQTGLGGQY